jgi:hypothetical protein
MSVIYCIAKVRAQLWDKFPRSTVGSIRFIELGNGVRSNLEQVTAIYAYAADSCLLQNPDN